ncbi:hypothetical protein HNY73_011498 [Argiope bruennichi]|uniref:Uncharacterized protein n=1 Tax=Argiope bruennichi TaxID=94029 RepID=A0A8T0F596_ARGBR|nr:hypothetical protein HNY73_011498 [Argiope bruennichi]
MKTRDTYEVCLTWKSGYPELESNKELTTKRLMSITKNPIRSRHLSEYDDVFNEWIREGIIEIVDEDKNKGHYLNPHPVIKTGDTTTKIRLVFDASAKDSKGNCLNNYLEKGIVTEVLPGADGHSRVARVRTAQGKKLRSFQRLYSLEIRSSEELPFIAQQKDKDTNTQLPATPVVSDQDSSEDDDYITKVAPDAVTKAGRRIKIPSRLNL